MPRLSAIIITKNEAANIGECLDSLAFCDERIVVDSGSTDGTLEIAKNKGARVVLHDWKGYGPQKNHALSLAQGDWVLSIDADERVTSELAQAINKAIDAGEVDGYEMARRSTFCGREMRHSGWFPDWVLRLFRRNKARFSDDIVHERVICEGRVVRFTAPLMHYPVARLEDSIRRMDNIQRSAPRRSSPPASRSRSSPASRMGRSHSCVSMCCVSDFSMARQGFCWPSRTQRERTTAT